MFSIDQYFFITFEAFGDASLKGKVDVTLFLFSVLKRSSLLKTFTESICSICFVTLSNSFFQKVLGMVFKFFNR